MVFIIIINYWLFRFHSPLLTKSRLISFPTPTEMIHFRAFKLKVYLRNAIIFTWSFWLINLLFVRLASYPYQSLWLLVMLKLNCHRFFYYFDRLLLFHPQRRTRVQNYKRKQKKFVIVPSPKENPWPQLFFAFLLSVQSNKIAAGLQKCQTK